MALALPRRRSRYCDLAATVGAMIGRERFWRMAANLR
jgi:hypothetical protein